MIITNHGHIGGMGSNFFVELPENPEAEWINEEVERWFDCYLKGIDNGVDEDPEVVYYRHHDPDNYGEAYEYPLPGTQQVSLYMNDGAGGGANLSTQSPQGGFSWPDIMINIGITGSVSLFYFQDITEMVGGETMDIPTRMKLFEIPFTECDFITEPLQEDVTIMGAPMLELYYQSVQRFAQLSPFLYEVTPEGEEILVSRGWYEGQKLEAWEMVNTAEEPIEMQACYHRFPAGSRIKLELATADLAMTWPVWGFNMIFLHHNNQAPSRIILPTVP
jgi:predicted acyl esterase